MWAYYCIQQTNQDIGGKPGRLRDLYGGRNNYTQQNRERPEKPTCGMDYWSVCQTACTRDIRCEGVMTAAFISYSN